MNNYIVKDSLGYTEYYNNTTLEDVKKIIKDKQTKRLADFTKDLETSTKELEYFKNKEYDKIKILDRDYFLNRGQAGLDDLERAIYREIDINNQRINEYQNGTPYTIFEERKEENKNE